MKFISPLLAVMLIATPLQAQAETAYQRFMRIAGQARQRGDFNTALINYGRAQRKNQEIQLLTQPYQNYLKKDYKIWQEVILNTSEISELQTKLTMMATTT